MDSKSISTSQIKNNLTYKNMKTLILLTFSLTGIMLNAQQDDEDAKLRFNTSELFDIKTSKKGGPTKKTALVIWTIDFKEPAVLIAPQGSDAVVIFFEKEDLTYRKEGEIVIANIETEDNDITFLLGPGNYYKAKVLFKKDMTPDGSYDRVLVYTNYPVDNMATALSNQHE